MNADRKEPTTVKQNPGNDTTTALRDTAAPQAAPKTIGRFEWVDAAKGFCMALVVLLHIAGWYATEINDGGPTVWWSFSEAFAPLRMPLFFFISGFLVAPSLFKTLTSTRRKTIGLFFVYAVWTALFISRLVIPAARGGAAAPSPADMLLSLALPTSFWYLWALPVFFLIAMLCTRVLGRFRLWALVPFAVLAMLAPVMDRAAADVLQAPLGRLEVGSVVANLVWFYAAVCGRDVWLRIMENARWWKFAVAAGVYAALFTVSTMAGVLVEVKFVLAPFALFAAAQALGLLNMRLGIFRALRWVGQLTLPVYIFHIFAISALSAVVKLSGLAPMLDSPLWAFILPPVLAFAILIVSRKLGHLILGSRVSWLLSAPDWMVGAPAPRKVPAS